MRLSHLLVSGQKVQVEEPNRAVCAANDDGYVIAEDVQHIDAVTWLNTEIVLAGNCLPYDQSRLYRLCVPVLGHGGRNLRELGHARAAQLGVSLKLPLATALNAAFFLLYKGHRDVEHLPIAQAEAFRLPWSRAGRQGKGALAQMPHGHRAQ